MSNHVLSKPELRRSKPGRADFAAQARNPITVVLDGVTGNYNIGAMFRLCDAFLGRAAGDLRRYHSVAAAQAEGRPGGVRDAMLGAMVRDARRRHGGASGQGSGAMDRGGGTDGRERHAGTDAATLSGCAGARQRALRRFARGAGLCGSDGRDSNAGHGELAECRHCRRDRVARAARRRAPSMLIPNQEQRLPCRTPF